MSGFQELIDSPIISRLGTAHWEAIQTLVCAEDSGLGLENILWRSELAGYTGPWVPRCHMVRRHRSGSPVPGLALFTAHYKTGRKPGVARVAGGKFWVELEHASHDTDDHMVDGFDVDAWIEDNSDAHWYKPTKGTAYRTRVRGVFAIETAYEGAYPLADTYGRLNHINADNFLGLAGGHCLLLGQPFTNVYEGDDLWEADFTFGYDGDGWNDQLKVRKHSRVAIEIPTMDMTGTISTWRQREMMTWLPVHKDEAGAWVASPEESRKQFAETSFSDLNTWVANGYGK